MKRSGAAQAALVIPFSRACTDNAAGVWMPDVSATTLEELEVAAQRQACRTITGCAKSTPVRP